MRDKKQKVEMRVIWYAQGLDKVQLRLSMVRRHVKRRGDSSTLQVPTADRGVH